MSTPCKAKQHSDQMICDACALQWDVNDPERPECRQRRASDRNPFIEILEQLDRDL